MHLWHLSFIKLCVNASNTTSDAASVSSAVFFWSFLNTDLIWMATTLQFLIMQTELIET